MAAVHAIQANLATQQWEASMYNFLRVFSLNNKTISSYCNIRVMETDMIFVLSFNDKNNIMRTKIAPKKVPAVVRSDGHAGHEWRQPGIPHLFPNNKSNGGDQAYDIADNKFEQ